MKFKNMIIAAALLAVGPSAFAADEIVVDKTAEPASEPETVSNKVKANSIRITVGSAPGIDKVEDSGGSGTVSDDGGARVEIVYVHRFWSKNNPNIGGSLGGGIFMGSHALSNSGVEVELSTFGIMGQGGFIARAGDMVVLEVGPYLGVGSANNETTGYAEGSGTYGLFGVKGAAFIQLGENVELGLELGAEGFSHEQEYEGGWIGNETVTFSGSGVHAAAVLSVKF